jgi:hypothetical protein
MKYAYKRIYVWHENQWWTFRPIEWEYICIVGSKNMFETCYLPPKCSLINKPKFISNDLTTQRKDILVINELKNKSPEWFEKQRKIILGELSK